MRVRECHQSYQVLSSNDNHTTIDQYSWSLKKLGAVTKVCNVPIFEHSSYWIWPPTLDMRNIPEFTIVIFINYNYQLRDLKWIKMTWSRWKIKENCHHALIRTVSWKLTFYNPFVMLWCIVRALTVGAAYIRVFIFYQHILNMVKIKCDINQQDLKRVDLHFVKSE